MRLIVHTRVGTFVKDGARQIDKLNLLMIVNGYSETFELTCRPEGPCGITGKTRRCVFLSSDYRYLEIEEE
jgi:hypothetical protein